MACPRLCYIIELHFAGLCKKKRIEFQWRFSMLLLQPLSPALPPIWWRKNYFPSPTIYNCSNLCVIFWVFLTKDSDSVYSFFFFSFRIYKYSHLSLIWMFINLPFFLLLEYLCWEFCVDVSIKCKIFWIFKLCVQIMTLILSTRFEILSLNKNRERNWKKKKKVKLQSSSTRGETCTYTSSTTKIQTDT